jgi:hypothetical protein
MKEFSIIHDAGYAMSIVVKVKGHFEIESIACVGFTSNARSLTGLCVTEQPSGHKYFQAKSGAIWKGSLVSCRRMRVSEVPNEVKELLQ